MNTKTHRDLAPTRPTHYFDIILVANVTLTPLLV